MKKLTVLATTAMITTAMVCGCGATQNDISVISREEGSGTRGAFVELFGVEQKDADGNKVDYTTEEASITSSTSVVLTSVAGDDNAIGYISLGSLNYTVKALEIDGVLPSVANIKDGSYSIARPFNIVVNDNLTETASDFIAYILSVDGQQIVTDNGYIALDTTTEYEPQDMTGTIVVAGSSSVSPVMEKLAESYEAINPDVDVQIQTSDSSTGVSSTIEGVCDIGMASRDLKDSELESGVTAINIAMDGMAVIVNQNNPLNNLTTEQVRNIYMGEITTWDELEQ